MSPTGSAAPRRDELFLRVPDAVQRETLHR
jgi:hypothetical protein